MNKVVGRSSSFFSYLSRRTIHYSRSNNQFWVSSKKEHYDKKCNPDPRDVLKYGLKQIPIECGKFKDEIIKAVKYDQIHLLDNGDYKILWKFDSPEILENWVVTSDSDHNEGKSNAEFVLNQNNKAVFSGNVNTDVPKDGKVKLAGYCNIMSPVYEISFKRIRPYDLSIYTHLLIRLRGDGRSYNIGLNIKRTFDVQWNDIYSFPLYTRGGPYWQTAKIPFSKFFLSSKGRVQDKQKAVPLHLIQTIGITLGDGNTGPFKLELDYVGVIYDASHTSTFEYEMYSTTMHAL